MLLDMDAPLVVEVPQVPERALDARGGGWLALGVLALLGAGVGVCLQSAWPERFPSLTRMALWMMAPLAVPSDFFPGLAWGLALLPWVLLALALSVGHRLARRAGAPLGLGVLELWVFVLVPLLHLLGGPYVLRALERAVESRKPGLRLRLVARVLVALALQGGAGICERFAVRSPTEDALLMAGAMRIVAGAAFVAVLCGVGRALAVLARFVEVPVEGRAPVTREEGARASGLGWAAMLVATAGAIAGAWFSLSVGRACAPGTAPQSSGDSEGRRVLGCMLPDGRRQGPEWVRGPDGRLLAMGEYREGARHGLFREWDEQGAPWRDRSYADDMPQGLWTLYQRNGQHGLDETYAKGVREGPSTRYYSNGNKRLVKHYGGGLAHGGYSTWFDSGQRNEEGAFEKGAPSGWWVRRDQKGDVLKQWSAGPSRSAETAGAAMVVGTPIPGAPDEVVLRAGHTLEWWRERLDLLHHKAATDPSFAALYELTLRRARANGFTAQEHAQGVMLVLDSTP